MTADHSASVAFGKASLAPSGTGGNGVRTEHPVPRCKLILHSNKVTLSHRVQKKSKHATAPVGVLNISVTCDQAAKVTLTGAITERVKKSGHHRTKTLSLRVRQGVLKAPGTATFVERLPQAALAGLKTGKREWVVLKLVINANGHTTVISRALGLVGRSGP